MADQGNSGNRKSGKFSAFLDGSMDIALPSRRSMFVFWSILVGGFLADIISKRLVFQWVRQVSRPIEIVGQTVRFVVAENPGAAFGIAAGRTTMLVGVSIFALAAIIVMYMLSGKEGRLIQLGLALFGAGVAGNLWDRIFNQGRVRDFIDVQYMQGRHWPAFNLADTFLCIAVALLVLGSFFSRKPDQKHDPQ